MPRRCAVKIDLVSVPASPPSLAMRAFSLFRTAAVLSVLALFSAPGAAGTGAESFEVEFEVVLQKGNVQTFTVEGTSGVMG